MLAQLIAATFFSLIATGLDTSSLDTSSLSTGGSQTISQKPVEGSSILMSSYEISADSPSAFLVGKIIELEKAVADYETLPSGEKKKKDDEIRKIVSSALDLDRLGRRALITYWDKLGKSKAGLKKRKTYIKLFKELVEENYIQKTRTYMSGKYQIPLVREEPGPRGSHLILGRIKKSDVDLIVEFKLLKTESDYRVADVRLDETSLESTYRGSFNRIIRKKGGLEAGFPELLRVMRKRLDELKQGSATRL